MAQTTRVPPMPFDLRQGDSLLLGGKLTHRSGEPPVEQNVSGVTAVVTIRAVKDDGKLGAVAAQPPLVWVSAMGAYTISVDETVTATWKPGSYVLEVEFTFPGADPKVVTMPEEQFTVTRRVKP